MALRDIPRPKLIPGAACIKDDERVVEMVA